MLSLFTPGQEKAIMLYLEKYFPERSTQLNLYKYSVKEGQSEHAIYRVTFNTGEALLKHELPDLFKLEQEYNITISIHSFSSSYLCIKFEPSNEIKPNKTTFNYLNQ